jgi:hypothetical protein
VRVASPTNNGQFHFVIDGTNYPEMNVPNTGGYQTWETVDSGTTYMFPKNSQHTVMLVCDSGGFNVNYWQYHDDIPIGVNVSLQAEDNGKWVTASNGTLTASVSSPGTNEWFTVVDASGANGYGYGYVALLAWANNLYVTADTNGAQPLAANSASIAGPQLFEWADNGDGTILLRAVADSMMVTATTNPSSYPLIANGIRATSGLEQTFLLTQHSTNLLSFVAQPNNTVEGSPITAGNLNEVQIQAMSGAGTPMTGAAITLNIDSGDGTITGNSAMTDTNGIAHFPSLTIAKAGPKTLLASGSNVASAVSLSFNITAGPAASLGVETAGNGSGTVLPAEDVTVGSSVIAFAISRDASGNFISNVPAAWSLVDVTGSVASSDLVPSEDDRSTVFTGHGLGTAVIQAVAGLTAQSGLQTVTVIPPSFSSGTFTNDSVLALAGPPSLELYGVSMGGTESRTTTHGYAFSGYPGEDVSYGSGGYGAGVFLSGGGTSGDPNFDAVLNNAELGINSGTLVLEGLAIGTTYSVLFLEADTRNVGSRTFSITGTSSSSPAQSYAFPGGTPALGGYIMATFVASATTESFTNTAGDYGYQLNGLLVEKVPLNTPATIGTVTYSSASLVFSGSNGPPNGAYQILTSTNLDLPLSLWTSIATNSFNSTGAFSDTVPLNVGEPSRFYRLTQGPALK